jgi:hypothetical protein
MSVSGGHAFSALLFVKTVTGGDTLCGKPSKPSGSSKSLILIKLVGFHMQKRRPSLRNEKLLWLLPQRG